MRRYVVDECIDDTEALQKMLDEMSNEGWRIVSSMWLPRRPNRFDPQDSYNSQYTVIWEREISNANRT